MSEPRVPEALAKILIVDDRVENLIALEAVLEPLGHLLLRATSGPEALKLVLMHDFAVVLMDVQMPEMNGFETIRLIRGRERSRHIPVIFLTAISKEQEYVFEGYAAGAVDYLFKPFDPTILTSKVEVFVDLYLQGQRLHAQERLLREASEREGALRYQAELRQREAEAARELTTVNEELRMRERELRHAMQARSRFYSHMSHELRTPINAILGYSSLLIDQVYGPLQDRQLGAVDRTHRAANHLLELVNDILDLSKIEAGKLELALEPVSPTALIEDLLVTVEPFAREHGSELRFEVEGELGMLVTDSRRMRQILLNLISNAVKFGEGNPVHVLCRGCGEGVVVVEVRDQGSGIAEADQQKIFEEFVQVGGDGNRGTGLGLPISLRLAQLLGGSLDVESELGEGSTFRLVLPASTPLQELAADG